MYKKQIMWQKIICFAAIAAGAVVFLYALGLMTDLFDSLYYTMMDPSNPDDTWVQGSRIFYDMQPFNKQLLSASIVLVLLSCFLFITATHSRRRYYGGNVLSTLLYAVCGVGVSVWSHVQLEKWKSVYLQVNFEELEFFADMMDTYYTDSTFWFDAHYGVFALVLLVCVLLLANMCWKFSLMKAEKRLIEEGKKVGA
ncbi:MAG: hypothetical protein E7326_00095 [Clostridiales bacterium]|nr:hypothetical protein [Clostridiales bacterium]